MCEPMTILAITSAVGGLYQQQQMMEAQDAANKQQYQNTMTAYRHNQANANLTRVQESQNLADAKVTNNAAARRAISTATVSAGESGVSGLSVDALLADLAGRAGNDNANAEVNYLRRDNAIQSDMMNNWAGASSQINSLKTPAAPDYLGAALKIGQAGESSATLGKYFKS